MNGQENEIMGLNEIIEMGVKAELCDEYGTINFEYGYRDEIIAFAKLVAAKEREACAKVVEQCVWPKSAEHPYDTRDVFAAAIRARV
jgi:hypothetical protein